MTWKGARTVGLYLSLCLNLVLAVHFVQARAAAAAMISHAINPLTNASAQLAEILSWPQIDNSSVLVGPLTQVAQAQAVVNAAATSGSPVLRQLSQRLSAA